MLPLVVVFLIALAWRLERVRRYGPNLRVWIRSAPVTHGYLGVLLVTSWVLATSTPGTARRLLLERSTNLHQLAHDPVRVLVASAFWLDSPWELLGWALLFTLLLAPLERRIGSGRFTAVLAAGHVGATLVIAGGLWAAIRLGIVEQSVSRAQDVGVSYAFCAAAAAVVPMLPPLRRYLGAAILVGWVGIAAAVSQDFTAAGHLVALAIGAACYLLLRRGSAAPRRRPAPRPLPEADTSGI